MSKPLMWDDLASSPADWSSWREVVHLIPADPRVVPQYAIQTSTGWAMTQGRDNSTGRNATDDLILSAFPPGGGRAVETRAVLRGGHGDRAYPVGGRLVTLISGVWAWVEFGSPWRWRHTTTPPRCKVKPRKSIDLQGEAPLGGDRFLRLYGGSIKTDPSWHPGETAFLEVLDGLRTVRKISLDHVARDEHGDPIGGRYEPEGVSVGTIDGVRCALVGFAVGPLGATTMRVYALPLAHLL